MKRSKKLQYTIRSVPASVDQALRNRARSEAKSLNQAALEALHRGAGVSPEGRIYTDLDDLIGTWQEDPEFDKAIAAQDVVDRRLWR
jgi:hypothetical protein